MPVLTSSQQRVNIMLDEKIVKASYNLRAIVDYAREVSSVKLMHIFKESDDRGYLHIVFNNGAYCDTYFADYSVLKTWCYNRMEFCSGFESVGYSEQ